MDYGGLITRAFQVTWRNRALWVFGFLFALTSGGSGFGGNAGNFTPGGGNRSGPDGGTPNLPAINQQTVLVIVAAVACIVIIWLILATILRFVSRGALVGLVQELESSSTAPTVRRGFSIGMDRFVPLFGIGLIVNIPLALVSGIVILVAIIPVLASLLPAIASGSSRTPDQFVPLILTGVFSSLFLICCAILVLVIISVLVRPFYEFFVRACVIGKRGAMDSIREGYRLVRANAGKVAMLYILIIGIGIAFAILMIPVAIILIGLPVGAAFGAYFIANSIGPAIVVGLIIGIPMVVVLLIVSGFIAAFDSTLWTEGYLALTVPPATAAPVEPPAPPAVSAPPA